MLATFSMFGECVIAANTEADTNIHGYVLVTNRIDLGPCN